MILSIDPGTTQSAFVIWNNGLINEKGIVENSILLHMIESMSVMNVVLIEMVASYGMPVGATIFETCVWIGRFMQKTLDRGFEVELIFRKDVKMHHCHTNRAKDSNIRAALIDKYGSPGTKKYPTPIYNDGIIKMKKDIWSAFAILAFWIETR